MGNPIVALLAPKSVALVGVSADPDRVSSRPLRYLQRDGWAGTIYPVNPGRDSVFGVPAWPTLSALPEIPEHVFVLTSTDSVIPVIKECAELGVSVATILAGGFGESGPSGTKRQQDLVKIAAEGGVRLLGPNAIGVVDTRTGFTLTANAAFGGGPLLRGSTFVASQSGSMIGALLSRAKSRGSGFAALVSVGGEIDLSIGEICASTLDDPGIDSYALFLETLSHAADLRSFALSAAQRGKPVLVYKLGRSRAASDLVVTHTGALAGDDDVADAFFGDSGMARVETIEGLLEGAILAPRTPIRSTTAPPRVGVLTATGGGGAMLVDQLGIRGIEATPTSAQLHQQLRRVVGYEISHSRIVDLTLRGTDAELMATALRVLRSSDEFDLIVQVLGSSATTTPDEAVRPAVEAPLGDVPLAVFLLPDAPDALANLVRHHVPAFRTPESCADAVAALLRRRAPRHIPPAAEVELGSLELLDELSTYRLLDRLGIPRAPVSTIAVGADPAAMSVEYPVALKALIPGVAHKTEADAVALGIGDAESLRQAVQEMDGRIQAQRPTTDGVVYFLQPMVSGVVEVLLGFVRDPQVGPLVLLAPGGVQAELFDQRSLRLAPVDRATARLMVAEVPAIAAVLAGFRGRPGGDIEGLTRAIVAMSTLAAVPSVAEAEVNPLIVGTNGVVAVDAVARAARTVDPTAIS